mmetsp:Transcript_10894/g.17514  ORF Transcript_10894/g.17514 Transcript_10894/m.17514 type:complete len:212 (+) Transcript_10894:53-688(+)
MADVYWTCRHELFVREEGKGDGESNLKEAGKNYATAWSIFASLLMTVSFSLIPVDTGSFYDDNSDAGNRICSFVYVALLLISTMSSFLAVLVGTFRYTFWDGIPAPMVGSAIQAMQLPGSEFFVYGAMLAQMLASVAGCYLFLGFQMLIMAIIIFLVFLVPGFIYVGMAYRASIKAVDGLQVARAVNLGGVKAANAGRADNNGSEETNQLQ